MTNTKETNHIQFGLYGLSWGFKVDPERWPVLEINASALWFGDSFPSPNQKLLSAGVVEAIEQAFGVRGAK
jgi:hypothetical protein